MNNVTFDTVIGKSSCHIVFDLLEVPVHNELVAPIAQLRQDALANGFQLHIASGFRDFDRQLNIWNRKACGELAVLDDLGEAVDISRYTELQLVQAILRWSALPGASRHHWGTDIDVYDAGAINADYQLRLTVAETVGTGPFAAFHSWLDCYLTSKSCDFYRPYSRDFGGVAPEPWHLSYRPLATQMAAKLTESALLELIQNSTICLKATLLEHLPYIYRQYVTNVEG